MKAIQRIVRNGNSAQVTIPRAMLFEQKLRPGDFIEIESFEDGHVLLRPWRSANATIGPSPGVITPPMPEPPR